MARSALLVMDVQRSIVDIAEADSATSTIRQYLDCARSGEHGTTLEMCPDLRAELLALARRLDARQAELRETQRRLSELTSH